MHTDARKQEIDANYDYLQRTLALLLPEHEGQYALLKNRHLVGFYANAAAAYKDALDRFPDHMFSVQEVTEEPLDLGFFSHAGA